MKISIYVNRFSLFFYTALLVFLSCTHNSEKQNYLQAKVNGVDFRSTDFTTFSFYYDSQFKSTRIYAESDKKHLELTFFQNDLLNENSDFHYLHDSNSSGIIGSYYDLNEMTDPENTPIYYSISGNISVSGIDTGTYQGNNGVIMNLEATFNFITDSIHGNPKTIENGKIHFDRN